MKKVIFILAATGVLLLSNSLYAQSEMRIETSSADMFFRMADKIASGMEPTDEQWKELFQTKGYKKCIAETFDERGLFIRKAMHMAFNPAEANKRDSIMNVPVTEIISDWEALLTRVMLQNYLDTKQNREAIEQQLKDADNDLLSAKACERLKNFLVNPVDSLIRPIPVSILCMEPDALSLSGRIVWDANFFRKQSLQERVDLLAHEIFHAYCRNFVDHSKAPALIRLLSFWQGEGIADLINKKDISDLSSEFIRFGLPEAYVEEYNDIYNSTPQIIKELEQVTLSFIRGGISEKDFNAKLSGFIKFGGHPNGYYMTTLIKNAGLEEELIGSFASPVKFMKLYNEVVAQEWKLGSEFMDYLDKIK